MIRSAAPAASVITVLAIGAAFLLGEGGRTVALTIALFCQLSLMMFTLLQLPGPTRIAPAAVAGGSNEGPQSALIDDLTGVASRAGALLEAQRRLGADGDVHCAVFDVDDFKQINAHLGTEAGDELLEATAGALVALLPDWDIGRLGGDEFVGFADRPLSEWERGNLTALELATSNGTRIGQLSAGVTTTSLSGRNVDDLLRDAQTALRVAKGGGKQRAVVLNEELRDSDARRRQVAEDVRRALEDNCLVAWGQPLVDLATDRPAGIELLARWPRSDGTFESPHNFIPVVETLGYSALLGEFMLREAIDVLRHFNELGDDASFVTINLSAGHLAEPLLASLIAVQLDAHGIAPERLIVELTESQRLPDSPAGRSAIDRLRSLGVGVATDDLGAGWSTLSQMMRSQFTHVKTDRELVAASARPGGVELLEAIRMIAEGAGQVPIAEGIETEAELDIVRMAGFRFGQGWLLGRPSPIEATLAMFDTCAFDDVDSLAPSEPA